MSTPTIIERPSPDYLKQGSLNSVAYCFVVQCLWNLDGLTPAECTRLRQLLAAWSKRFDLACPPDHIEGTIQIAVESYERDAAAKNSELFESAVAHLREHLDPDQRTAFLNDLQELAAVDGPPAEGQLSFIAKLQRRFASSAAPGPNTTRAVPAAPAAATFIERPDTGTATLIERPAAAADGAATLLESAAPGAGQAAVVGFAAGAEVFGCTLREPIKVVSGEADLWIADRRGERVVLKVYRWGLHPKAEIAAVLEQSDHRHVVRLLERGMVPDGRSVEVLEYVSGGTLEALLSRATTDESFRTEIVRELALALDELHRADLMHRDIKPANILVRSTQPLDLVLADFGISSVTDLDLYKTSRDRTVPYSAPESTQGVVSKGSDWWSLGIIVLEILLGRHPYAGLDNLTINVQLVTRPVPFPEDLPPRWRMLVAGLLTKDHENRWRFDQVNRWLAGEENIPVHFESATALASTSASKPFLFEKGEFVDAMSLAVALANSPVEGAKRLSRGLVSGWVASQLGEHELASQLEDLREDKQLKPAEKLAMAVLLMNPRLPLTLGGEVVTPGWLSANHAEAVALVDGPIPDWLAKARNDRRFLDLRERRKGLRAAVAQTKVVCDQRLVDLLAFSDPAAVRTRAETERKTQARATLAPLEAALRETPLSAANAVLLLAADGSQFVSWRQHFEEMRADLTQRAQALRTLVDEAVTSRRKLQTHRGTSGKLAQELDKLCKECKATLTLAPQDIDALISILEGCRARADERLAEHEEHQKLLELALRGQVTSVRDQLTHRPFSDIDYQKVEAAAQRWETETAQLRTALAEARPQGAVPGPGFDLSAEQARVTLATLTKFLAQTAPQVAQFEQAAGAQRGAEVFAETRLSVARLRRGHDWLQDYTKAEARALDRCRQRTVQFYVGCAMASVVILALAVVWARGH